MMSGLLPPTSGEIIIDGNEVQSASVAMKRVLGVVPQELAIYTKLTAIENLTFFGELYGLRGKVLTDRVANMLELVGLTSRGATQAHTYSGGMKRRLNLAVGLMHNPQLLLLDEPTVGVDPQSRNHIFEGVRKLNREGLTLLYTSHYMEEVELLCDRVGIMENGKIIACDTVPNLIAGMGGAIIEASIGSESPSDTLLANIRKLDHVLEVSFSPGQTSDETPASESEPVGAPILKVRSDQPDRALPALIMALNSGAIPIHALNIKQPNLEDVFLKLTGKQLRD